MRNQLTRFALLAIVAAMLAACALGGHVGPVGAGGHVL
jgi:predicted small lipoprotein YifL